jgi:putative copper export protein
LWLVLKPGVPETIKGETLVRFSNVSLVAAPLVGATGILSAYFRIHAVAPLITTPYGRYVLLKAACFFVLIGLGAANRFRLIPALRGSSYHGLRYLSRRRLGEGGSEARSTGTEISLAENWQRLRTNILIEQVLLIVVLFAVARLGLLPPPDLK